MSDAALFESIALEAWTDNVFCWQWFAGNGGGYTLENDRPGGLAALFADVPGVRECQLENIARFFMAYKWGMPPNRVDTRRRWSEFVGAGGLDLCLEC